ncbi:hypothetical protein [Amycolatopsis granulosa]|uniref:hypothetical protein n=1 Tax=Amycolatopsis granulosa TaxID=185684 RepID=UPI001422FB6D|nr:hypothetical protein [Amycolatopsis granulosa]NIH84570.1 hypothetical protein [Amycolatopsis granulosa]
MKSRKGARAAVALAAAALGVLAFDGTASAAPAPPDGGSWDHVWKGSSGDFTIYVKEYGDVVSICDTKADGKTPRVWVGLGNGKTTQYTFTAPGGKFACNTKRASDGAKYNLTEGKRYTVTGCAWGCGAWPFTNDH